MSSIKMVSPESVGLDSKVLSNTRTYLEEQYVNPGKYVGTLTLVARKGEVAYLDAVGLMDRENKKAMPTFLYSSWYLAFLFSSMLLDNFLAL